MPDPLHLYTVTLTVDVLVLARNDTDAVNVADRGSLDDALRDARGQPEAFRTRTLPLGYGADSAVPTPDGSTVTLAEARRTDPEADGHLTAGDRLAEGVRREMAAVEASGA